MSVRDSITRLAAVALVGLAGFAPALRAEPIDRLGVFLSGVIDRLDATGGLNVPDYDCAVIKPGLQECTDPVTGLYFLNSADPLSANLGLSVVKGRVLDGKDLTLADRESGERLLAGFKALPDTALSGRDRCALPEGVKTDGKTFGVKPPQGSYPAYVIYGGLDDAALAVLDRAGGEGEMLSAILLVAMTVESCRPFE